MRSQEEIKRQILSLEKEKKALDKESIWGKNVHEMIDAMISVLNGDASSEDYWIDDTAKEYKEGDNDIWEAAYDAKYWLTHSKAGDLFGTLISNL